MDVLIGYNYNNNTHHKIATNEEGYLYTVNNNESTTITELALSDNQVISGATIDNPIYSTSSDISLKSKGCILINDNNVDSNNSYIIQVSNDNILFNDYKNIYLFNSTSTSRSGYLDLDLSLHKYIRIRYNTDSTVSATIKLI
jgi:hypothetical protein